MSLTQERLREVLHYEPETGVFTWRVSRQGGSATVGKEAGGESVFGYVSIKIDGRRYFAHRLAFLYILGRFPEEQVDHINRDRSDNRWKNLREATASENQRNVSSWSTNTSGYKGVTFIARLSKYQAQIRHNSKYIYLGIFDCPQEAASAYNAAARELHGDFAALSPVGDFDD